MIGYNVIENNLCKIYAFAYLSFLLVFTSKTQLWGSSSVREEIDNKIGTYTFVLQGQCRLFNMTPRLLSAPQLQTKSICPSFQRPQKGLYSYQHISHRSARILDIQQFGFEKGLSTQTALLSAVKTYKKNLVTWRNKSIQYTL